MSTQKTLESDRLVLRKLEPNDTRNIQSLANDKNITDNTLSLPYPYEIGVAETWINSVNTKGQNGIKLAYAITIKSSKELIGVVSFTDINKKFAKAEVGYWIGKKYWGNGFCTEAVKTLIDYGFNELGLNKITAHHMLKNPASGKVMLKSGMIKEGYFREEVIKCGVFEDIIHYGILRKEWLSTQS